MEFTELVAPLRDELHAHCYRMLGSSHDADDALQEAMLRAWRGLGAVRSPDAVRSWIYTVATRTCLDVIQRRGKRALPVDLGPASTFALTADVPDDEVAWLTPYPAYEHRESVELAFVAALQHLPGNQRAALLLVEVLGFTPAEVAHMMSTTVASVNSALQRARALIASKAPTPVQRVDDARARALAATYADALRRGDVGALVAMLTEDVTWSMPPLRGWYAGLAAVRDFAERIPMGSCGQWQHLLTRANGQPAVASYSCPDGGDAFGAWSIDVFSFRDDRVCAITSFIGVTHFAAFGLPAVYQ
ncbi:RNA polymerase ECF family sigma subunit [Asanoa ferruginea]|uniref:RNA polymerase ECF family sigma subunit n=1 Tax=Asanoa ferruginea TaxID=53367 RepID=A0A3D9ZQZ8_9ACTN|nr:RNA polymerase subunit sigma-70 [Asanoa ferruginea]REF99587.1 RNA polymerase ECF family sigma subunit [Asanoa ferruginea]GIF53493.1 RNA polymerase sigma factor [Asanoa ferruginea]